MDIGWLLTNLVAAFLLPPLNLVLIGFFGLWLLSRNTPGRPKGFLAPSGGDRRAAEISGALKRRRFLGKTLVTVALLGLALLSTPYIAKRYLALFEAAPLTTVDADAAEAIVILGGGTYPNAPEFGADTVRYSTLERLRYGAWLARRVGKPILVTGGAPDGGPAEAPLMQAVLEQDFRVKVRWVEDRSSNTRENAALSAALLKQDGVSRIWLVSQAWHLPRAIPEFERHGLTVIAAGTSFVNTASTIPLDFVPNGAYLRLSHHATHEAIGRLWYRLRALFD